MTKTRYFCNFCQSEFGESVGRPITELIGVFWETSTVASLRGVEAAENHICRNCLSELARIANEVRVRDQK